VPPQYPDGHALWAIIGLTAGVGLASAVVASAFLALPDGPRRALVPHLVSYATGALLGATLLGLLPEAIRGAGAARIELVGIAVLAGLVCFFVLEKFVLWRHAHGESPEPAMTDDARHRHATGALVIWGTTLHNVLDGVVIASAYLASPRLGQATAIAVFAHELPQEIGDLGVLLHSGMSRRRALLANLLVSVSAVVGGWVAYRTMAGERLLLPYAIAFAAASLLYIAVADLIPGLQRQVDLRRSAQQLLLILLGIGTIWLTQPATGGGGGPP
jgi:zinc and cadmium transporter